MFQLLFTDIDECAGSSPCENGGSCINKHGDYVCDCVIGYHGKNCNSGERFIFLMQYLIDLFVAALHRFAWGTNGKHCSDWNRKQVFSSHVTLHISYLDD